MARSLASCGLPLSFQSKLDKAGFKTAQDVLECKPAQLSKELGLKIEDANQLLILLGGGGGGGSGSVAAAAAAGSALGTSALDLMKQHRPHLITMCAEFDKALGGGVPTGCLTEMFGVPGVGKTQLGIQLACDAQIPHVLLFLLLSVSVSTVTFLLLFSLFCSLACWAVVNGGSMLRLTQGHGGLQAQTVYIDTEGSFVPSRAAEIAQALINHLQIMVSNGTHIKFLPAAPRVPSRPFQ